MTGPIAPAGRRRPRRGPGAHAALAALLLVMGTLHFLVPGPFERIVPRFLGSARLWVFLSGAAEVVSGAALLVPATRRAGAWGAAVTLVAVFPGNVEMALRAGVPATPVAAALWLRLPLQAPLVAWAVRYTRSRPPDARMWR